MIVYIEKCDLCNTKFEIVEGTEKYKNRKKDRNQKFWCDFCESSIIEQAKKNFLGKL